MADLALIPAVAKVGYVLVLIYSPYAITAEPRTNVSACRHEAAQRIGSEQPGAEAGAVYQDGRIVNVKPHVIAAFCTRGQAENPK